MVKYFRLAALALPFIATPAYADFHGGSGGGFHGGFRGPVSGHFAGRQFRAFRRSPQGPVVIVPFAVPFAYGYVPVPCAGILGVDAFTCAPLYPYTYAQPYPYGP